MPIPPAAAGDGKGAFPSKQGTSERSRGASVEDSSTKFVKTMVFIKQEPLFEESIFPMWLFQGPKPNN